MPQACPEPVEGIRVAEHQVRPGPGPARTAPYSTSYRTHCTTSVDALLVVLDGFGIYINQWC
jgi:hypothetical protein